MEIFKLRPVCCQGINVRRFNHLVAHAAKPVSAMLISDEKQKIGLVSHYNLYPDSAKSHDGTATLRPASIAARMSETSCSVTINGGDRIMFGPDTRTIVPLLKISS